ncbi:MAG: HupE/UreJ family protein [Pirellulales bacterium]|nr:HupE/UreJ family protein [Pirellulales bacterium]
MPSEKLRLIVVALAALGCSFAPAIAQAHPGHGISDRWGDFPSGWIHPFTGIDHLLAMVAVGLLAVRMGGRGLWLLPMAFLGSMLLGGAAAFANWSLPGVEAGILTSVLVFGSLLALTRVVPLWLGVALAAMFAMFHGYAHASEMGGESATRFAAGFLLATAALHAAGIAAGMVLAFWRQEKTIRIVGGAIAAAGLVMMISGL